MIVRSKILWTAAIVFSLSSALPVRADVLQDLIDSATEGQLIRVPSGRYYGSYQIKRPLTLVAEHDVILDGKGQGSILKIEAPHVTIQGLIFQHSGTVIGNSDSALRVENSEHFTLRNSIIQNTLFGIQLMNSKKGLIENNQISGFSDFDLGRRGDAIKVWYSPGTRIHKNKVGQSRDILIWYSDGSIVSENEIHGLRYGLHYMYSHHNTAEKNLIEFNSVGIYGMYSNDLKISGNLLLANRGPSGYGLAVKEANQIQVVHNHIVGNRIGLQIDNSPISPPTHAEEATYFQNNRIAHNDIGVTFVGVGSGSHFLRNDFIDNWQQVSTKGMRSSPTVWLNNYWSDYRGVDPQGKGIGMIPYVADSITDEITDRFEGFKLFNFAPALLALQFAEKMIPWLKANERAKDVAPVMRPQTSFNKGEGPSENVRFLFFAFSAGLLLLVCALRYGTSI